MSQIKKLLAREIMNVDLVSLRADTPVADAVATLEEYHITGAPVVDDTGTCVGVFTASDVVKRGREMEEAHARGSGDYFNIDPLTLEIGESFSVEDYDEEVLGRDTVGQWMTTEVKAVPPEATVEEVCRRMVSERIHRVLVMDGKKLRGIITSFDIVALVAGLTKGRAAPSRVRNIPPHR